MKLRISYFNPEAFRKNITRFAPLWGLYLIFGLLITVLLRGNTSSGYYFAKDVGWSLPFMAVINLGYALLCGQLLFGDLYNTRLCNALHAMPLRREGWFFTNVLSGLAFSFGPNVIVTVLMMLLSGSYGLIPLLWLLVTTLQFLAFFGIAVFSAYCTGNRFAMALIYGIINFLSMLVLYLVQLLYEPLLYGMTISSEPFELLCPVVQMASSEYFSELGKEDYIRGIISADWSAVGTCAIFAAVGVALMVVGLLMYRKRNLECAGDFIAVKPLAPVFLTLYSLFVAAFVYVFFDAFFGSEAIAFLFIGLAIGFFTGQMLLERSVRVFRGKKWLGFGLMAGALALSLILTALDPVGITRWVPEVKEIKAMHLASYEYGVRYSDEYLVTDEETIAQLLQVHQQAVDDRADANYDRTVSACIRYELTNGSTAYREYEVLVDSPAGDILKSYFSTPEIIFQGLYRDMDSFRQDIVYTYTDMGEEIPAERYTELLQALEKDWQTGNLSPNYSFHRDEETVTSIMFDIKTEFGYYTIAIQIWTDAEHTAAWLEKYGYQTYQTEYAEKY